MKARYRRGLAVLSSMAAVFCCLTSLTPVSAGVGIGNAGGGGGTNGYYAAAKACWDSGKVEIYYPEYPYYNTSVTEWKGPNVSGKGDQVRPYAANTSGSPYPVGNQFIGHIKDWSEGPPRKYLTTNGTASGPLDTSITGSGAESSVVLWWNPTPAGAYQGWGSPKVLGPTQSFGGPNGYSWACYPARGWFTNKTTPTPTPVPTPPPPPQYPIVNCDGQPVQTPQVGQTYIRSQSASQFVVFTTISAQATNTPWDNPSLYTSMVCVSWTPSPPNIPKNWDGTTGSWSSKVTLSLYRVYRNGNAASIDTTDSNQLNGNDPHDAPNGAADNASAFQWDWNNADLNPSSGWKTGQSGLTSTASWTKRTPGPAGCGAGGGPAGCQPETHSYKTVCGGTGPGSSWVAGDTSCDPNDPNGTNAGASCPTGSAGRDGMCISAVEFWIPWCQAWLSYQWTTRTANYDALGNLTGYTYTTNYMYFQGNGPRQLDGYTDPASQVRFQGTICGGNGYYAQDYKETSPPAPHPRVQFEPVAQH